MAIRRNKSLSSKFNESLVTDKNIQEIIVEETGVEALPSQENNDGKFLTTDGVDTSWGNIDIPEALPNQVGADGKFLTTDGVDTSWATIVAGDATGTTISTVELIATDLQTNFTVSYDPSNVFVLRNGIELSTNDFTATNGTNVVLTSGAAEGDIITVRSFNEVAITSTYTIDEVDVLLNGLDTLPDQTDKAGKYLTTDGTDATWSDVEAGIKTITEADIKTVGTGGDFATIREAIEYFNNSVKGNPTSEILGEISILAGYDATETITVYNTNLAWVKISSIDAQVAGTFNITAEGTSTLPQIVANFANLTIYVIENSFVNINSDQGICYLSAKHGSSILIPKSIFTCETLTMYSQSNSNIEGQNLVSVNGGAIYAQDGGVIHASYITMKRDVVNTNSSHLNISGGRMHVDSINMDGFDDTSRNLGIMVTNAGILNCGTINLDWDGSGITVEDGSIVNTGVINVNDCSASSGVVKVKTAGKLSCSTIDGTRYSGSNGGVLTITSGGVTSVGNVIADGCTGSISGALKMETGALGYIGTVKMRNAGTGSIPFYIKLNTGSRAYIYSGDVSGTDMSCNYVSVDGQSEVSIRGLDFTGVTIGSASNYGAVWSRWGSKVKITYSNLNGYRLKVELGGTINQHQNDNNTNLSQTANTVTAAGIIYSN
ncbi:MAG: hypothetical protein U9R03_04460 [Candidatus Aerophobetes bacterium]|nr:hypothetical protein [Candidatus Aerophobetes bacterium]